MMISDDGVKFYVQFLLLFFFFAPVIVERRYTYVHTNDDTEIPRWRRRENEIKRSRTTKTSAARARRSTRRHYARVRRRAPEGVINAKSIPPYRTLNAGYVKSPSSSAPNFLRYSKRRRVHFKLFRLNLYVYPVRGYVYTYKLFPEHHGSLYT